MAKLLRQRGPHRPTSSHPAMTVSSMRVVTVTVLTTVVTLLTTRPCAAMDFHGMEDNCILSFVVPRDKVKSSCDMEDRVIRRLNAMETKVTLYKQHVQELQEQLSKERELHRHRLDDLQERLTDRDASLADAGMQKRIQVLEEELRKIRTTMASSARPTPGPVPGDGHHGRGGGVGVMPAGRSREEEEKVVTVLVKTVVRSEVKKLFDNYTHYVGRYVRDQALAFNQIINMVPRQGDQSFHNNRNNHHLPPKWPNSKINRNEIERQSTTPPPLDREALEELEDIRNRLNNTGRKMVDHVQNVLNSKSLPTTLKPPTTPPAASGGVTDSSVPPSMPPHNDHDPIKDNLIEINETASGDANETASELNLAMLFTQLANDSAHNLDAPSSPESDSSPSKDIASAQSRMSYNADLNKLPDPEEAGSGGGRPEEVDPNVSGNWQGMVHDQIDGQLQQKLMRTQMQELLEAQVREVVSLVTKHASMMDTKLTDHEHKFGQLEQRLTADIKHLSQEVSGLQLEMTSVSQGLQALYSRVDSLDHLQTTVNELSRNVSQDGGSRLLASLLDEQGKKVRKMERLTGIYKQSLEHYRNDSKMELRALKEVMGVRVNSLVSQQTDLYTNLTDQARATAQQLNTTTRARLEEIKQRVQVMEDNSLLQQIDLSSFERQLKSKTAKNERDLGRVSGEVGELKQKTRNLQKNLNSVMTGQGHLSRALNATSGRMQQLKIEVQLNVLDDWVPYEFDYMKTRTDCFGAQFIRKSGFKVGRLVGVVLCTQDRYKIFLGQNLDDTFRNIGDDSGMGEDHCQFVNAKSMSRVRVSPFRTSTETEPGFVRTHWNQEPRHELLNIIRPSPAWYECGVSIP
ncbi:hypothetical protein ACOMHN_007617 [Nucella lapillus]